MVKGGRGHCWEKESERDGTSEREREIEREHDPEKNKMNRALYDLLGCGSRSRKMFPFENNARGILYI